MKLTSISPLRLADGTWVTDAKQKAELFSEVWLAKYALPSLSSEDLFFSDPGPVNQHVIFFNTRTCERLFKKLKDQTSTGPDGLQASILKFEGPLIAIPFTRLVRKMVDEGIWPETWRITQTLWGVTESETSFSARGRRGCLQRAISHSRHGISAILAWSISMERLLCRRYAIGACDQ